MIKPKNVYLVINTGRSTGIQILGCFYSEDEAIRYAGNSANIIVQKISVL